MLSNAFFASKRFNFTRSTSLIIMTCNTLVPASVLRNVIHIRCCSTAVPPTKPTPPANRRTHSERPRLRFSDMYESLAIEDTIAADSKTSCKSQKLMLNHGIIHQAFSGVFHFLPMGLRSLNKLKCLINETMRCIGAQEVSLSTISSGQLWKKSGRWESIGSELFKLDDRHGLSYCLGATYEEVITALMASHRSVSHRKLPLRLYQMTRKFRDEMAPKYGLLRGREFEMKDLYTFDADTEAAMKTYEVVCQAYENLLNRLDLNFVKVTGATGHIGGSLSHEYHIPADVGQDLLLLCDSCGFASNDELISSEKTDTNCPNCGSPKLKQSKGIEIGHSFLLGRKYSEVFQAKFQSSAGPPTLFEMGCYGIGVSRLLASGVEVLSSEEKLKWPRLLAPHQVCIIPQKEGHKSDVTWSLAEQLYDALSTLPNMDREVVLDDRTKFSIGKRVKQAERLGFPYAIAVGRQALDDVPRYEMIDIYNGKTSHLESCELLSHFREVDTIII